MDPMELYQLRTFLTIAGTGNLTRAAAILRASQPAVSAQIKALEDELGLALFLRTPKGMELTEAGRALLAKAEQVSAGAEELLELAGAMRGRIVGTCRIGLNTEAGVLRVPALVDALSEAAPGLEVELVHAVSGAILEDVASGRLSAGFVFGPQRRPGLEAVTLSRLKLLVAAPARWGSRLEGAPLSRLLEEPWVWPPRECPFHEKTVGLFRHAGCEAPPRGVTADDESTLLRLVGAEAGLSLLPAFLVEEGRAKGEVVALGGPASEIELCFVWRTREEGSPLVATLRETVRRVWEDGSGRGPPQNGPAHDGCG